MKAKELTNDCLRTVELAGAPRDLPAPRVGEPDHCCAAVKTKTTLFTAPHPDALTRRMAPLCVNKPAWQAFK